MLVTTCLIEDITLWPIILLIATFTFAVLLTLVNTGFTLIEARDRALASTRELKKKNASVSIKVAEPVTKPSRKEDSVVKSVNKSSVVSSVAKSSVKSSANPPKQQPPKPAAEEKKQPPVKK